MVIFERNPSERRSRTKELAARADGILVDELEECSFRLRWDSWKRRMTSAYTLSWRD